MTKYGGCCVIAAFALLTACSGAGSVGVTPTSPSHGGSQKQSTGYVTFSLGIPKATVSSTARIGRGRKRQDISPATASVSLTLESVNGVTQTGQTPDVMNFLPTSPNCSAGSNGDLLTCTVTIGAPAGTDVYSAVAYSDYNAAGSQLSQGSVSATVTAGSTTAAPLTLDGIIAAIHLGVASAGLLPVGVTSTFAVFVLASDAAGETIIGSAPYASPISLSVTDPTGETTFGTMSLTSPTVAVTGTYDGTSVTTPTTISIGASASGVPAGSVTPVTFQTDDERGWTNGATLNYTGTSSTQIVPISGSPPPATTSTTTAAVQVSTNASFQGQTGLIELAETDTVTPSGGSASTSTTDSYYSYGVTSTTPVPIDYAGEVITNSYGSTQTYVEQNSMLDELPEAAGSTWANLGQYTSTYVANGSDPNPSQDYSASDGTYTFSERLANNALGPEATANADGSGNYTYYYSDNSSHVFTIGAPVAGASGMVIPVTEQVYAAGNGTPTSTTSANVPDWYAGGGAYPTSPLSDTYADAGTVTVPAACNVAATYAGSANEIDESYSIIDPVIGDIYTYTRRNFVEPNVGRVCSLFSGSQQYYYAIGNAANENNGIPEIFIGSLLYTNVSSTTSGLQSNGAAAAARVRHAR